MVYGWIRGLDQCGLSRRFRCFCGEYTVFDFGFEGVPNRESAFYQKGSSLGWGEGERINGGFGENQEERRGNGERNTKVREYFGGGKINYPKPKSDNKGAEGNMQVGRDQPAKEGASTVALTIQELDVAKIQSNDIVKVEAAFPLDANRMPAPTDSLYSTSRGKAQTVAVAISIPARDPVDPPALGRIADPAAPQLHSIGSGEPLPIKVIVYRYCPTIDC